MVRGTDIARDGVMEQRLECFDPLRMMHRGLLSSLFSACLQMHGILAYILGFGTGMSVPIVDPTSHPISHAILYTLYTIHSN